MPSVKSYSTTPGNNTVVFVEGQQPSTVNNGVRQIKADLAELYRDQGWREIGDGDGSGSGGTDYTAVFVSGTQIRFDGVDVTDIYEKGMIVRANVDGGAFIYGLLTDVSFATDSTLTFVWDGGAALTDGSIRVWVGENPVDDQNIPVAAVKEIPQSPAIVSGALSIDPLHGTWVNVSLTENITTITATWPDGATSITLRMQQDATGSRTVVWPAAWKWSQGVEGQITPDANAEDIFTVASFDGGTNVYAFQAGIALS